MSDWKKTTPRSFPAFPYQHNPAHGGMSLRDWFAGQVMCSIAEYIAVQPMKAGCPRETAIAAARLSYEFADAMLEVRSE